MCGGGGGGAPQTITQTTQVPQFMQDYFNWQTQQQQGLFNTAQNIYNTNSNYQTYPGQRIQPLTNDQMNSIGMIRQNTGMDPNIPALGTSQLNSANNLNNQATQKFTAPGVASSYMSPYIGNVIDTTMNEMNRQQNLDQQGVNDQATAAGAFGGDRQAVANALTNKNWDNTKANTIAGLYNSGFGQAGQLFNSDQNRILGASQNAASLANQAQQMGAFNASQLMGAGNVVQNQGQQALNVNYQDFLNQRQWPYQNFGFLESALRAQPFTPLGQTSTQQVPTQGALQQAAGLGLTGAAIAGMTGAFQ